MQVGEFIETLDRTQTLEEILAQVDEDKHAAVLCSIYAVFKLSGQFDPGRDGPTAEDLGAFAEYVERWE